MKILALEFSAPERSAAVAKKNPDGSVEILSTCQEKDFRGVTGLALIDRALGQNGTKPEEISLLAVGLGPGSYTGIRSAIAIAQGWQLGRGIKLLGISSVHVLAEQARTRNLHGEVTIVIDAQRKELYAAGYQINPSEIIELEPLRILSSAEISVQGTILGPEASRFLPGALDMAPSAEILARIAAQRSDFLPGENLEPIYLRQLAFVKAPIPRHIA